MVASAEHSGPLKRHGALAWSCAVAISAAALGVRLDLGPVVLAACAFLAVAAVHWAVKKWARRLVGSSLAAATPAIATLRASAFFGLLALWLWTLAFLVPAALVYPEPAMNRAYAESLGIELGTLIIASLGVCIAVTLAVVSAMRVLGEPAPQGSVLLRAACVLAPLACLALAVAPHVYFPDLKSTWDSFGADLPSPTLLLLSTNAYWGMLPAVSLGLSALAWMRRTNAVVFTRSVFAQSILLMCCSALLTFAVAAAWLPLFKMCGVV